MCRNSASCRVRQPFGALIRLLLVSLIPTAAYAQAAPPQQATPAPNPWTFRTDAGVILNFIKPDKTADFEGIVKRVKDELAATNNAGRKQQAAGWKIFKAAESGPNGSVIYVSVMDPVAKGSDYSIGTLLVDASGEDIRTTVTKYLEAFSTSAVNLLHLTLVNDLGK